VWGILQPILQLASVMIENAHTTQWRVLMFEAGLILNKANGFRWDALWFGERKHLISGTQPPTHRSFQKRQAKVFYENRSELQEIFALAAGNIVWKIDHGCLDVQTGLTKPRDKDDRKPDSFMAITVLRGVWGRHPIQITVAKRMLKPFLHPRGMTV
jgi:hypothetical protein